MVLSNLLQVVQAETILCSEIAALMERVLKALMVRDSAMVQEELSQYHELSQGLAQAEAVRTRVYEQCCELYKTKPEDGMAALVGRMEVAHRPAFTTALRSFKTSVYTMRSLSQGIASYTGSQLITLESFMAELIPQRHSGVYGSDGSRSATGRPILVDSLR